MVGFFQYFDFAISYHKGSSFVHLDYLCRNSASARTIKHKNWLCIEQKRNYVIQVQINVKGRWVAASQKDKFK